MQVQTGQKYINRILTGVIGDLWCFRDTENANKSIVLVVNMEGFLNFISVLRA